jgi:hypothetical protein
MCHSAKDNRRLEINHNLNRHKERVRNLLSSKEGLYHRSMRPVEPESVFAQGKSNKQYNRFRYFSTNNDKVMMAFAIFAIAFNIGKLHNKGKNMSKNGQKPAKSFFEVLLKNSLPLRSQKITIKDMGRKRLKRPEVEQINTMISSMLVPAHILAYFEIWDAQESRERWVIEMREKEGKIPAALLGYNDAIFDGYTNPTETLSHSFVCKPGWLRLYRWRYRRANTETHYSNEYDVSQKGVRMVPEPGLFLKEEDGGTAGQYSRCRPDVLFESSQPVKASVCVQSGTYRREHAY